jgi:hypothetical protein
MATRRKEESMKNKTSTGNYSTGDCSTGDYSTGNYSTGNRSTGNCSTGYCSTGNYSTGSYSTGSYSTGNFSTGYCSTGNYSTGSYSTGSYSTGNFSTGYCSTGDYSTGSWSISNYSTGHFSTEDYSGFGAFNKPCSVEEWKSTKKPDFIHFGLTEWVDLSDMTEQEKIDNPSCETTRGYLKVYDYQEAWRKAWDSATDEDKELLYALPNFDEKVFKEISGIDVNEKIREVTIEEIEKELGYRIKIKGSKEKAW